MKTLLKGFWKAVFLILATTGQALADIEYKVWGELPSLGHDLDRVASMFSDSGLATFAGAIFMVGLVGGGGAALMAALRGQQPRFLPMIAAMVFGAMVWIGFIVPKEQIFIIDEVTQQHHVTKPLPIALTKTLEMTNKFEQFAVKLYDTSAPIGSPMFAKTGFVAFDLLKNLGATASLHNVNMGGGQFYLTASLTEYSKRCIIPEILNPTIFPMMSEDSLLDANAQNGLLIAELEKAANPALSIVVYKSTGQQVVTCAEAYQQIKSAYMVASINNPTLRTGCIRHSFASDALCTSAVGHLLNVAQGVGVPGGGGGAGVSTDPSTYLNDLAFFKGIVDIMPAFGSDAATIANAGRVAVEQSNGAFTRHMASAGAKTRWLLRFALFLSPLLAMFLLTPRADKVVGAWFYLIVLNTVSFIVILVGYSLYMSTISQCADLGQMEALGCLMGTGFDLEAATSSITTITLLAGAILGMVWRSGDAAFAQMLRSHDQSAAAGGAVGIGRSAEVAADSAKSYGRAHGISEEAWTALAKGGDRWAQAGRGSAYSELAQGAEAAGRWQQAGGGDAATAARDYAGQLQGAADMGGVTQQLDAARKNAALQGTDANKRAERTLAEQAQLSAYQTASPTAQLTEKMQRAGETDPAAFAQREAAAQAVGQVADMKAVERDPEAMEQSRIYSNLEGVKSFEQKAKVFGIEDPGELAQATVGAKGESYTRATIAGTATGHTTFDSNNKPVRTTEKISVNSDNLAAVKELLTEGGWKGTDGSMQTLQKLVATGRAAEVAITRAGGVDGQITTATVDSGVTVQSTDKGRVDTGSATTHDSSHTTTTLTTIMTGNRSEQWNTNLTHAGAGTVFHGSALETMTTDGSQAHIKGSGMGQSINDDAAFAGKAANWASFMTSQLAQFESRTGSDTDTSGAQISVNAGVDGKVRAGTPDFVPAGGSISAHAGLSGSGSMGVNSNDTITRNLTTQKLNSMAHDTRAEVMKTAKAQGWTSAQQAQAFDKQLGEKVKGFAGQAGVAQPQQTHHGASKVTEPVKSAIESAKAKISKVPGGSKAAQQISDLQQQVDSKQSGQQPGGGQSQARPGGDLEAIRQRHAAMKK